MEADDNEGDTEELWVTLSSMGFNKALNLDEVRLGVDEDYIILIKEKLIKSFVECALLVYPHTNAIGGYHGSAWSWHC